MGSLNSLGLRGVVVDTSTLDVCVCLVWLVIWIYAYPDVPLYPGLCITIPPRGVRRKLQDVEDVGSSDQPKVGVFDLSLIPELIPRTAYP